MTASPQTIPALLERGADGTTALSSPGGTPLSYAALRGLVRDITRSVNARAIGAGDRVAIVLDNGPEMAAAFLSIASAATAAPLNPSYRAEEFEFYLTDLQARLLVVGKDKDSPSIEVAKRLNVPVARLVAQPERGAGTFTLAFGDDRHVTRSVRDATPDDVALVLHTSGTTSRPKIVPLAHKNIAASAANIRKTLALTDWRSCRSFTSTDSLPRFSRHCQRVVRCAAPPASTPSSSFRGWRRCSRRGTQAFRRCTRRFCYVHRATPM
jgi:acyl-CoA synthetase (AMP-forming)/AMP-acid ligase II